MQLARLLALFGLVSGAAIAEPDYIGSTQCATCHAAEMQSWRGSHHDLAMAEADEQSVLGDFADAEFTAHGVTSRFFRRDGGYFVHTDGPDGQMHDYRIRYTFGWYPLQQYLIELADGHVQALGIAWDSRIAAEGGQHWFHLYPEADMDRRHPQHWTSRDQTWNYQCAECHSTDLQKNYDLASDRYATHWAEIDVACEACHGPGSRHLAWAQARAVDPAKAPSDNGLVIDLTDRDQAVWTEDPATGRLRRSVPRQQDRQIVVCARCHSRRSPIAQDYEFGAPFSDLYRLALLEPSLYYPDGQIKDEVYVYGSFVQSKMYAAGVTCSDCHEPHSLQLRAPGNAVCTRCHRADRYDTDTHHHHAVGTDAAACTACHMPQRVYMVNDWRADHGLRVPRPDLSARLGTPNPCTGCHRDRDDAWAADALVTWYPDSTHRGPHFGEALHAADVGAPDAAQRLMAVAGDPVQPAIARATAVDRLRQIAAPSDPFTLSRLLADPDPLVRAAAVRYLASTDVRTQVQEAWAMLDDPIRLVRLDAERLLAPLMRQGLPAQYRERLTAAIKEYAAAQYVNAERPESHVNLGQVAATMGDAQQAELAYRMALKLDAGFTPAYVNLADLYRQQRREADGERVLREGLQAIPGDASLQHALGLLLVREQRLDDALVALHAAAVAAPGNPHYAYVYALALQKAGDKDQALNVLQALAADHPTDRETLIGLVTLRRDGGDLDGAREALGRLVEQFPHDPQVEALRAALETH